MAETGARADGAAPVRRRGRPPATGEALSPEAIVDRALEFIEREGAGALTVRRLGAELGVDPTAFYRHFRDKDDLVLACMDRAEQWAVDALRDRLTAGDPWQDVLRAVADESWRIAGTYPAIYASAFARTTGGPGERRMVELLLTTIAGLGLDRPSTVLFYRAFADCLLSLCGANALVDQLGPEVEAKESSAWARVYAAPSAEYPATRAHVGELLSVTDRAIYDRVIEAMIQAMEAAATASG